MNRELKPTNKIITAFENITKNPRYKCACLCFGLLLTIAIFWATSCSDILPILKPGLVSPGFTWFRLRPVGNEFFKNLLVWQSRRVSLTHNLILRNVSFFFFFLKIMCMNVFLVYVCTSILWGRVRFRAAKQPPALTLQRLASFTRLQRLFRIPMIDWYGLLRKVPPETLWFSCLTFPIYMGRKRKSAFPRSPHLKPYFCHGKGKTTESLR